MRISTVHIKRNLSMIYRVPWLSTAALVPDAVLSLCALAPPRGQGLVVFVQWGFRNKSLREASHTNTRLTTSKLELAVFENEHIGGIWTLISGPTSWFDTWTNLWVNVYLWVLLAPQASRFDNIQYFERALCIAPTPSCGCIGWETLKNWFSAECFWTLIVGKVFLNFLSTTR